MPGADAAFLMSIEVSCEIFGHYTIGSNNYAFITQWWMV